MMLDGHFVIEHTARNRSGRFFNFNGTAGIWRRSAIDRRRRLAARHAHRGHGPLVSRAAARLAVRLSARTSSRRPSCPVEMNAFKSQQFRWAKGSIQIAKKLLPTIWRSKDVPFSVKMEAFFHLTNNFAYPLLVLLSILLLAEPARAHAPRLARGAAASTCRCSSARRCRSRRSTSRRSARWSATGSRRCAACRS